MDQISPAKFKLPPIGTWIVMSTAFAVAALCVLSKHFAFPLNLASVLVYVIGILFHECGHAITGILLGMPSVPTPMLMTVTFERRWWLQIVILILLFAGCAWLKKKRGNEEFLIGLIFTLFIIFLAFTGYHELIVSYMGTGGAILFGGLFQYRAWVFKENFNKLKQWFFAWLGFSLVMDNINFFYELITDTKVREKYLQGTVFGMHNDFTKISEQTNFSLDTVSAFTIGFGILVTVTVFLLALFPSNKPDQNLIER